MKTGDDGTRASGSSHVGGARDRKRQLRGREGAGWACLAVALSAAFPAEAGAAEPVEVRYTRLDFDLCRTREVDEDGTGASLVCDGLPGFPVFVKEGDLRFDVDFGVEDASSDTFLPFNSLGPTIEWRLSKGQPFAAILRSIIENAEDPIKGRRGSVLGIYKVGRAGAPGCPVAYVDAVENPDANALAAKTADASVPVFRCGVDKARYVGRTGPFSGGATATQTP